MNTTTDPVRRRMTAANPAHIEATPPEDVMTAEALFDVIDARSQEVPTRPGTQGRGPSAVTRRLRRNPIAALAAGFILVLIVGVSAGLLTRGKGSPDVETPVTTPTAFGVGQTVGVTISGLAGHAQHDLAGVLYEGDGLTDLDREAVGGFWVGVADDDFTTTQLVRQPGGIGVGPFPYVTDEVLAVEPGVYTLIVWADYALNPVSRWVPLNTDNSGLIGCQHVFEVGEDALTEVAVAGDLSPDGWDVACTAGSLRDGDSPDVATPVTTPTAPTPGPAAPLFAPGEWDPILAETRANAAPLAATCPVDTNPDVPGAADQARPVPGFVGTQGAAFDRHRGRIVFVDRADEVWTFDVCTNTWQQMSPTDALPAEPRGGQLVYDVDSDRIISLQGTTGFVYDPNSNTRAEISIPEGDEGLRSRVLVEGAVYDPVSGLVIAQLREGVHIDMLVDQVVLSAYDVDTDLWSHVGLIEDEDSRYWRNLVGYSSQTDELILMGYDGGFSGGEGTPIAINPRNGMRTEAGLNPTIAGAFSILTYATDTGTAYVLTRPDGDFCRFDPAARDWKTCFDAPSDPGVRGNGFYSAMVGDPINNQLVLINPMPWNAEDRNTDLDHEGSVWAIDLDTGEWTQLLAPSTP
ncbi:MAG: hypothetical protein OES13_06295 [Acidimicrobiia bacterium]|nr:hypothetical protein [Acidimicrobiia bacterium]